jgi:F-type H+-transporting ATPase subunit b
MDKPLIDWFTVVAQIINFLVLVYLLKRFLYGKILQVMDEREQKIAARLAEAGTRQEEAGRVLLEYQNQVKEFDTQRESHLTKMREEVEQQRKELLRKIREEVDLDRVRWYEQLSEEQKEFLAEFGQQISAGVLSIARQTLAELAEVDLEEHFTGVFLKRLRELPGEERQKLLHSITESEAPLVVESAFEIPEPLREKILQVLHEVVPDVQDMRFVRNPAFLCGIGLSSVDYKLAWETNHYLETLTGKLKDAVSERVSPKGEAAERIEHTA